VSLGDTVSFGPLRAKALGDVLRRLLRGKRFYQKGRYGALVQAWEQTVGEEIAARTRIAGFEHGRVSVEVDSPILHQELAGFMRCGILQELQSAPGGEDVAELRFRLGRREP
jgi:predicted nucleic acid-binding Zn ribbon protein